MKVRNAMTQRPTTCTVRDDLAVAAVKMWDEDCGILPVLDGDEVVGVITDRDIAMAVAMKGAAPSEVRVGEVISGRVYACAPDDPVQAALSTMAEHRVRRLLVIDRGILTGLLSLNDLVLEAAARAGAQKKPTYAQVFETLRAICRHAKIPAQVERRAS